MIIKWNLTIPELSGDVERKAYVYLPDEYKKKRNARYPVLYMFDGHNVFFDEDATYGKSWGMAEYMEKAKLPIIIAAVECNRSPDNSRICEYSPFTFTNDELGYVKSRGKITMNWLINTFKPYIDKKYPTIPDRKHTFIAGSSMGGLMSLYAVTTYNRYFSRAAALSPSIWFAEDQLNQMIYRAAIRPETVLYMDYGERELGHHGIVRDRFAKTAFRLMERGIMVDCRIVPNGEHNEASWQRQIPFFMNTLLYGID